MCSWCRPCRTLRCHTEDADGLVTRSSSMSWITPRSRSPPVKHRRIWTPIPPATIRLEMTPMPGTGASMIVKRWMAIMLAYKLLGAGSKRRRCWERPNSLSVYWVSSEGQSQDRTIESYALVHISRQISLFMSSSDKAIVDHRSCQVSSSKSWGMCHYIAYAESPYHARKSSTKQLLLRPHGPLSSSSDQSTNVSVVQSSKWAHWTRRPTESHFTFPVLELPTSEMVT
jgi:hypothetical protein